MRSFRGRAPLPLRRLSYLSVGSRWFSVPPVLISCKYERPNAGCAAAPDLRRRITGPQDLVQLLCRTGADDALSVGVS